MVWVKIIDTTMCAIGKLHSAIFWPISDQWVLPSWVYGLFTVTVKTAHAHINCTQSEIDDCKQIIHTFREYLTIKNLCMDKKLLATLQTI